MPLFQLFENKDLLQLLSKREGETKLGEVISLADSGNIDNALSSFEGNFVVFGIPEDIGVRANGGIGGTQTAWLPFLKSFINIQHTDTLDGTQFLVAGAYNFDDWLKECEGASAGQLREYTAKIDDLIFELIYKVVVHGKIPVVIGGGHNNAYPLLKALSASQKTAVNVVNLDAHSDFRAIEGRHSGNGFRYAYNDGYLKRYAILGLHEPYNGKNIVATLNANPDLQPCFFEDIFLRHKITWQDAITQSLTFVSQTTFGVELDVDCIENVLSSAATPVGISTQQAQQYLYQCGLNKNAAYLHLPEGVYQRVDGLQNNFTGKLLSYLVQSFCKGVLER